MKNICCFSALLGALALPATAQSIQAHVLPRFAFNSGPAPKSDAGSAPAGRRGVLAAPASSVALLGFAARPDGANARLEWATASEESGAYFNVERSLNGHSFQAIGQVAGRGAAPQAYFLLDPHVAQHGVPTLYYRLRQVRRDGSSTCSAVRTARVDAPAPLRLSTWPIPSTGGGPVIRVEQPTEGPLTAVLTDAAGRHLGEFRTTSRVSEGLFAAKTAALPSGVYLVRVTTTGTSQLLKLVRE